MANLGELLAVIGQLAAYLLAGIIIFQIIQALRGGTWAVEDLILALVGLNLTITFGIGGYIIYLNTKISNVHTKIHGHIEWHKGRNSTNH